MALAWLEWWTTRQSHQYQPWGLAWGVPRKGRYPQPTHRIQGEFQVVGVTIPQIRRVHMRRRIPQESRPLTSMRQSTFTRRRRNVCVTHHQILTDYFLTGLWSILMRTGKYCMSVKSGEGIVSDKRAELTLKITGILLSPDC